MVVVAAMLTGCDSVSERDCGVFDHPGLALWQSDAGVGQAMFMTQEGAVLQFTRQAVVLNEPFSEEDGSANDEDVVCNLTATVRQVATDQSFAIVSQYIQEELFLLASEDEALRVLHQIEMPPGRVLPGSFAADISVDRIRINVAPSLVEYLPEDVTSVDIGGVAYQDVVRIDPFSTSQDPADPADQASDVIRQIVMARQFGIVAFTDDEDREFVRVAN